MTINIRLLLLVPAALLTFVGSVGAQDRPSGVVNNLEVQKLVERGEPADHLQLQGHFTALADKYTREADRHVAMSKSFGGNPNRNLGTGMSAHCTRLAELSTQSATITRALATYHEKLAGGRPATLPPGGGRFEGGAGAPDPTEKELNALAAKARIPAEHRALEEYFLTLARRHTAEAREHVTWALAYRGTRIAQAAVHHDRLAELARDAAKEANDAAAMHKQLAAIGR